jgi:hypothetical protein
MSGITASAFAVTGAAISSVHAGTAANSYKVDLVPSANPSSVSLSLPAGSVSDLAGNAIGTSSALAVYYDATTPSLAISTTAASPTRVSPIPISITLSQKSSDFEASDIVVVGGSLSAFTTSDHIAYQAVIAPSSDGTITARINAGAAHADASGNPFTASNDFSITFDSSPPTGCSIQANAGAAYSTSRSIALSLSATGAAEMYLDGDIVDGTSARAWIAFANSAAVTLTDLDGLRTIQAKFRDLAGNISTAVSATITLDRSPPSGISLDLQPHGTRVKSQAMVLGITATGASAMLLTGDIAASSQTFSWVAFSTSVTLQLTSGDGTKAIHVKLRDLAGNESAQFDLEVVLDTHVNQPVPSTSSGSIVLSTTPLLFSFDETMDTSSFVISGSLSSSAIATYSVGAATVLTLTPSSKWPEGATGTLTIAASDIAGNAIVPLTVAYKVFDGVVYVRTSGSDSNPGTSDSPKATIQAAIATAASLYTTAEVHVGAGTYTVNSNALPEAKISMRQGISLYGGYPASSWNGRDWKANATKIVDSATDGGDSTTTTYPIDFTDFTSMNSSTVLDGFQVKGGGGTHVGGILIKNAGATISNCSVDAGVANGGCALGIALENTSATVIDHCNVTGGQATTYGCGIYCVSASPIITSCRVLGGTGFNSTTRGIDFNNSSAPIIRNCWINGGGVACSVTFGIEGSGGASDVKIQGNTICSGAGSGFTRGIELLESGQNTTPVIEDNIIFSAGSSPNKIGIYTYDQSGDSDPSVLRNNDIYNFPTALYYDKDGAGNLAAIKDIQANLPAQGVAVEGNVSIDPAFVDLDGLDSNLATMDDNDWSLSSSSTPFVTMGGRTLSAVFTTDISGTVRTVPWSIGACEYDALPASAVVYVSASGADANPGTDRDSFGSVKAGIDRLVAWGLPGEVRVSQGTYEVSYDGGTYIQMKPGIAVLGGYSAANWANRNWTTYPTTIQDTASTGGSGHPTKRAIYFDANTNSQSILEGFTVRAPSGVGRSSGIIVETGTPIIRNNKIYGGSTASQWSCGIEISSSGGTVVSNNTIYTQGTGTTDSIGIDVWSSTVQISDNFIHGGAGEMSWGICDGGSSTLIIIGNTVYGGSGQQSIAIFTYNSFMLTVENNALHAGGGANANGVSISSPGIIRNNTICGGVNGSGYVYGINIGQTTANIIIENNIIFTAGGLGRRGIYAYTSEGASGGIPYSLRNNDIWNCPTALYYDHNTSTSFTTISAMETNLTGQSVPASGNVSVDPLFVDIDGPDNILATMEDNNWSLQSGSTVKASGLNGRKSTENWDFSTDILGNPRTPVDNTTTGWSIGAYEVN